VRDIIVTLIVFGSIPFALVRPQVGVLVFSWISYMNPHRLTYGFAHDFPFAMVAALATIVGLMFSKESKRIPITPVTALWLMLVFWTCITTYAALVPDSALQAWDRFMKIQLMILVTLMIMNTKERIVQLVWVIMGSFAFYGVKGGAFALATGGNYRVWGPEGSFVEGNNEIALALVMILPLMRFLQQQVTNKWAKRAFVAAMILCGFAVLSSYSRGALLAGGTMVLFLWWKGEKKLISGFVLIVGVSVALAFMPQKWFERMDTIKTYDEDTSAMGRINAWWFAFNLANDRPIVGGGFETFDKQLFYKYAPVPEDHHDAHSIYFEVLGEQGYVGLILFLAMWIATFFTGSWILKKTKDHEELRWANQLAAMLQVCYIGYATGGAFLGLAYFDLPYHLMAILLLVRSIVAKELAAKEKTVQVGFVKI
jgi:probable O-glycosylation ligase (exosortase A-associated)